MRSKLFWSGIVVVVLSWFGNYLYFQSQQLEEPIFLDHYYESRIQDEITFSFFYLTNKVNPEDINYVEIDGVEFYPFSQGEFMMFNDNAAPQYEQNYRHHYLRKVMIQIPKQKIPLEENSGEEWTFDRMTVYFSNHPAEPLDAHIGQVKIYAPNRSEDVIDTRVSGGGQSRSDKSLIATDDITVQDISIPFSDKIADDVMIKADLNQEKLKELEALMHDGDFPEWYEKNLSKDFNDVPGTHLQDDLFPFSLDKDEWLHLYMQFNPERTSYYQFEVKIVGETEDGNTFVRPTPIIDHPYIDQEEVNRIIDEKKGGES